ncbi:pyridoxamine 5'-phosphate oxidase family protein [Fulvimarina sp. 2208YS6-2-32]|uniref:Pyridoxamine 5'-phosphate oxidase family protein n=1 Tax=Fulvimarina uroteuthidis TaxID=3098149 RepID=A0ABU5I3E0_9HYPH|nr:pyridoxamine 5'-phosphate oxidase family protein [Fulvimarina sp. 2208YS6-2-32]MDY8109890.1 pyridoxamine 5'-phosphate oxidase family protein [Fulvimarina sp. 2208YS6-2-32]
MPSDIVTSTEGLEALYGAVAPPSITKEVDHIHPAYRPFIEAAPFLVLATAGPEGLDATPRGDPAGFVHIEDERTLLLPDRRGNNRIDSLRNIISDPRVGLLFLIPGIGETLRVNGTATISVSEADLALFEHAGQRPRSVLRISVSSVFFQCSRAVIRAGLWNKETQIERSMLPSPGSILRQLSAGEVDGEAYDDALPKRLAETLY